MDVAQFSPRTSVKTVIVGDGAVGKTALLWSYAKGEFPDEYEPTVFDNYSCNLLVDGMPTTLMLWDTAGQEEYDRLRPMSYPGTDVFVVCFSLVNPASLSNVKQKWLPEIKYYCPGAKIVLVGCKSDLRDDPEVIARLARGGKVPVDEADATQLAREAGCSYMRCSALQFKGLKEVFDRVVWAVLRPPLSARPAKNGWLVARAVRTLMRQFHA
eukprot:6612411-Prymnesium_polylepis.1